MYINNLLNFQVSIPILNANPKKNLETYRMPLVHVFLSIFPLSINKYFVNI